MPTFLESGGLVVIEAEHYETSTPSAAGGRTWALVSDPDAVDPDSSGGAMQANGDGNWTDAQDEAQLTYQIEITTPGTYYVHVRHRGSNANGRLGVWVDDLVSPGANQFGMYPGQVGGTGYAVWTSRWNSGGGTKCSFVLDAGVHTVRVQPINQGSTIDRLILTTDSSASYNTEGPAESATSGGGTPTLSGLGLLGTGTLGTAALSTQTPLAGLGLTGTGALGLAALSTQTPLAGAGLVGSGSLGLASLTTDTALAGLGLAGSGRLGRASLTAANDLAGLGLVGSGALGRATLTTATALTGLGLTGGGTLGAATLSAATPLAGLGLSGSGRLGLATLSGVTDLTGRGLVGSGTLGRAALSTQTPLAALGLTGSGRLGLAALADAGLVPATITASLDPAYALSATLDPAYTLTATLD